MNLDFVKGLQIAIFLPLMDQIFLFVMGNGFEWNGEHADAGRHRVNKERAPQCGR